MLSQRLSRLSLALLSIGFAHAVVAGPVITDAQADNQAAAWVKQMTLDEKIQMVHGVGMPSPVGGASYIPGIARLGIPALASADSAGGVGGLNVPKSPATQFPAPLALAASWDPGLAYRYGAQIARELRALGFGEGLGGGIDLAREPRNGRTFEYLGEDPWLAGRMAAARTQGTQSQDVIATVKHFAANDQETQRFSSNSIIDERTLRELSLLPFEIAVKQGRVGNVMCSYNLVNGAKACQNGVLLTDILKNEWGFKGTVQSDWMMAVTDTVPAALAGLDEEEPGSQDDNALSFGVHSHYNQWLKAAVQNGQVPISRLNDMVARKLRTMLKLGIVAQPPKAGGYIDVAAGHALARQSAEQSMVLLKNNHATLPIDARAVRSIVLIGGHADVGVLAGGGSGGSGVQSSGAAPSPDNAVACLQPNSSIGNVHMMTGCATWFKSSPLAAIKARAPGVDVRYVDGGDASGGRGRRAGRHGDCVRNPVEQRRHGSVVAGAAQPTNRSRQSGLRSGCADPRSGRARQAHRGGPGKWHGADYALAEPGFGAARCLVSGGGRCSGAGAGTVWRREPIGKIAADFSAARRRPAAKDHQPSLG